jgi:hypothetical protein
LIVLFLIPYGIAILVNGNGVQSLYEDMISRPRHNAWILVLLFWIISMSVIGYGIVSTPDSPFVEMAQVAADKLPVDHIDTATVDKWNSFSGVPLGSIAKWALPDEAAPAVRVVSGGSWAWKIVPIFCWMFAILAIVIILTDDIGWMLHDLFTSLANKRRSATVASPANPTPATPATPALASTGASSLGANVNLSWLNPLSWSWLDEALFATLAALAVEYLTDGPRRPRRTI